MSHKNAKPTGSQKRSGSPPSHSLRPGDYLYWQRQIYRIVELYYETALQLLAETVPEATRVPLSLLDLFAKEGKQEERLLVASSLEALTKQMEERYAVSTEPGKVLAHNIPDAFVLKARLITFIVESVQQLVSEEERRAQALHEPFSQTQA